MSRLASLLAALLVLGGSARAEEPVPEAHAFVEIETPRARVYVGEPFTLTLRIGIDRAFFAGHAVELFRRPMDLPVQVEASWLEELDGTLALDATMPARTVRLAIGGREVLGARVPDQTRGDLRFEVVAVSRRYLPESVGRHDLEATLRFGYATHFEEDFLGGRVAVDRRDVFVRAEPMGVEVVALPETGRPDAFDGAVGRYSVSAGIAPSAGGAEDVLALTLVIRGEGNLAFVDPPPAERLEGFHVYGLVDDHGAPVRTVVYEIAPLPGTAAVPAIPFAFFDPGPPAGYGVAETGPIPLADPPPAPAPLDEQPEGGAFPWGRVLGLAALLLVIAVVLLRRRAVTRRAPAARASWSTRLAGEGTDPTGVLIDALATHLGVAPAAVVGPDLAKRLVAAGVEPDLAARTATATETLVGARFRREASPAVVSDELAALLDALDAAFAGEEGP